jgi:Arylsulfotransferase (ASST)
MKTPLFIFLVGWWCLLFPIPGKAYETLQGSTEVQFWNKTDACNGYTLFGSRRTSYLIDMEGHVVHTWPIGTNPRLLDYNGHLLDAATDDPSGFDGFKELDWEGNTVWEYLELRPDYAPHHDFVRIFNKQLNAYSTLYIANKSLTHDQAIAAGCDPANGPYDGAQMDAIIEVDMEGNIVWEWWFFDHVVQDIDPTKANYVGEGNTIADYPDRINLNLPGRPVKRDWLHCNSLDYNEELDQIVTNSVQGEFYVIDHGTTFIVGDPTASIALATGAAGDFLYRFGDPASILEDWTASTTGNKQLGGAHDVQWIKPFLNEQLNDTGDYVNPPDAGYYRWESPNKDTHKQTKQASNQIVWTYNSKSNQGCFSHVGSGAQLLTNGNTLICAMTEGHIFEVTSSGEVVWEYIIPITSDGIARYIRDNYPMYSSAFRAYRYSATHPAMADHTLTPQSTITGREPSYVSAPTISGTTHTPQAPTAADTVWVSSTITNSMAIGAVTLTYSANGGSSDVVMLAEEGADFYGGQIPALPEGTVIHYYIEAEDEFGNSSSDPPGTPGNFFSYIVGTSSGNSMLKLPDTGQTQGYTNTFGEDSDYSINPPSYTDNGNSIL